MLVPLATPASRPLSTPATCVPWLSHLLAWHRHRSFMPQPVTPKQVYNPTASLPLLPTLIPSYLTHTCATPEPFPGKTTCPTQPYLQTDHLEGPNIPQDHASCCPSCPAFWSRPSVSLVLKSLTRLARIWWMQGTALARMQHVAAQDSPACGSGCHPPRGCSRSQSQSPCPGSPCGCSALCCPAGKSRPGHLYLPGKQQGRKTTTITVSTGHLGCSQSAAPDPQHYGAEEYLWGRDLTLPQGVPPSHTSALTGRAVGA